MKKKTKLKLIDRFGLELFDDLESVKTKPFWCLSDISRKYGFSREYARQLFKSLYRKGAREFLKKKTNKIKEEVSYCKNDPRYKVAEYKTNSFQKKGAKVELLFFDKCKQLGYEIEFPCSHTIDTKINGYLVEIKSRFSSIKFPNNTFGYANFNLSKAQIKKANFVACYVYRRKSFFIIPVDVISKSRVVIIGEKTSDYCNAQNKYEPYKEAWHLLKQ